MYELPKTIDSKTRLKFLYEDVSFFLSVVDNKAYDLLFIVKVFHPMLHSHFVDSIFDDETALTAWLQAVEKRDEKLQRQFLRQFLTSILRDLEHRL